MLLGTRPSLTISSSSAMAVRPSPSLHLAWQSMALVYVTTVGRTPRTVEFFMAASRLSATRADPSGCLLCASITALSVTAVGATPCCRMRPGMARALRGLPSADLACWLMALVNATTGDTRPGGAARPGGGAMGVVGVVGMLVKVIVG